MWDEIQLNFTELRVGTQPQTTVLNAFTKGKTYQYGTNDKEKFNFYGPFEQYEWT